MKTVELKMGSQTLIPKCQIAETFFPRLIGLVGRNELRDDEALLFPRCNSIHTCFMRFPIDIVFMAHDGTVLEIVEALKPWRCLLPRFRALHILELRALKARVLGISDGKRICCEGIW